MKKIILAVISLYFVCCCISTVEIYNLIKYSFLTNNSYNECLSRYISKDIFEGINKSHFFDDKIPSKKKLKLYMLFSICNFKNGIVWMRYTFERKDLKNSVISGSYDVPMKIYIRREEWHWKIVKKEETP